MEEQPLLVFDDSNKKHAQSTQLIKCTCARCIKFIELIVMVLQIVVVILDWSSTCNRPLHTWMIVSLSYRPTSFIFQWIFIEPCLRYLRRDRSNTKVSSRTSLQESDCEQYCCINLIFCWIIPCLWLIDNDIFILIWTIIGTLLIVHTNTSISPLNTCSLDYIYSNSNPKLFYYTMIAVLILSYVYWITTLLISTSLFCCPQFINYCCFQMGYRIRTTVRRKEDRMRELRSGDISRISDMPGIRSTVSFSLTAPSRNNNNPTLIQQQKRYLPPNKNQPNQALPSHIFKQFERKVYTKVSLSKSASSTGGLDSKDSKIESFETEMKNELIASSNGLMSPHTPSFGLMINVLEDVAGLSNLPSPHVLRKISSEDINGLEGCDSIEDGRKSMFIPPLSQKVMGNKVVTVITSLFGRKKKKHAVILDVGDDYCSLCQNKYIEEDILIVLTCSHQFHEMCGKQWFMHRSVCPICKKNMSALL